LCSIGVYYHDLPNIHSILDDKLQILIGYYEAEKSNLLLLIDQFVQESDYLAAHHHFKALSRVNHQLKTLEGIADPLAYKKDPLRRNVQFYEKLIAVATSDISKTFHQEKLEQVWRELEALNQSSFPKNEELEIDLDIVLNELIKKEIKSFKLTLNFREPVYFNINRIKKTVELSFPHVNKNLNNQMFMHGWLKRLMKLGFQFSNDQSKLVLILPFSNDNDVLGLKTILSRMVYDVFNIKDFASHCFVEYVPSNNKKNQ